MAGIAGRARAAENALLAAGWNQAGIDAAASALGSDFQPLTDLRASSAYRSEVAANLLRRFYLEHSGMKLPLRTAAALLASG
jgi:xanthine dehydrogenase small subunit